MASYIYDPIDLTQPSIRLARLLGGEGDDIQCEIFQAWLNRPEDLIPYEALSYTWGSTEMTDHVNIINGSKLPVTQNLYLALQYLRFKDGDRILWIDSLCIDQANDAEKGHQVQQMGNIYHRAECVVIWLGPATYETNVLMDSMKLLEEESIDYSRNSWTFWYQAWRNIWTNIQPKLRSVHLDLEVRQRNGLESLFGRSWFSRIWIVQEVANAHAAIVVCGVKYVSARTFALVPSLMGIKPDPHCQSILDIMPGWSREESWWSQKRDLHTLLIKFSRSHASEPLDKIYALLGLSSDACDSDLLRADYSKPVPVIIVDTALFLLRDPELRHTGFQSRWNIPRFLETVSFLSNVVLRLGQHIEKELFMALLLARDDIEVNSKDGNGETLLQIAVKTGNVKLIRILVARDDLDINPKDKNGETPLQIAVTDRDTGEAIRKEVLRLLLTRDDIDVNSKDKNGKSPLRLAVENQAAEEVRLLLMRHDINVDFKDEDAESLLRTAVEKGNERVLRELLRVHEIDVDSKDENGKSLLHIAAELGPGSNWVYLVRELLGSHEFDLDSKDENGKSLLHIAVEKRNLKLVRELLEFHKIDVNLEDNEGISPLYKAVANRDGWIVRQLLASKGIDVNLKGLSDEALRWMASHNFVNRETADSQKSVEKQENVELPVHDEKKRRLLCIVM
jgi:ankyrin repeat protein